mmetsp:Transcript_84537/g.235827  ORF Transcript_84537/g.235827 Transcript_84537/m.235827 type:complete len:365 (-) Transcript_84537:241-1335(-)
MSALPIASFSSSKSSTEQFLKRSIASATSASAIDSASVSPALVLRFFPGTALGLMFRALEPRAPAHNFVRGAGLSSVSPVLLLRRFRGPGKAFGLMFNAFEPRAPAQSFVRCADLPSVPFPRLFGPLTPPLPLPLPPSFLSFPLSLPPPLPPSLPTPLPARLRSTLRSALRSALPPSLPESFPTLSSPMARPSVPRPSVPRPSVLRPRAPRALVVPASAARAFIELAKRPVPPRNEVGRGFWSDLPSKSGLRRSAGSVRRVGKAPTGLVRAWGLDVGPSPTVLEGGRRTARSPNRSGSLLLAVSGLVPRSPRSRTDEALSRGAPLPLPPSLRSRSTSLNLRFLTSLALCHGASTVRSRGPADED